MCRSNKLRPRPLYLFLEFLESKFSVVLENAFTFKTSRPKHIVKMIRSILSEYWGEESCGYEIVESGRKINLCFQCDRIDIDIIGKILGAYSLVFNNAMFVYPNYTRREYQRLGLSVLNRKLIIVMAPYEEVEDSIIEESRFMIYPVMTLPNEDGKYFVSDIGFDYLYFPTFSVASEKRKKFYIYSFEPGKLEPELVDIAAMIKDILRRVDVLFVDKEIVGILKKLAEKPYTLFKYADRLEDMLKSLEESTKIFGAKTPKVYEPAFPERMYVFMYMMSPAPEETREIRKLVEKIKVVKKTEEMLKKLYLYKIIASALKQNEVILSGKIITQRTGSLHKLGGGKAVYISEKEAREVLGDKQSAKVILIEGHDGKKRIIIEPLDED